MKRLASPGMLAALVAANAALLLALAASSSARQAHALGGGPNYVLAVGQSVGLSQEIVYLVDAESGRAAAIAVNAGSKRIDLYGGRDITKDLNGRPGLQK